MDRGGPRSESKLVSIHSTVPFLVSSHRDGEGTETDGREWRKYLIKSSMTVVIRHNLRSPRLPLNDSSTFIKVGTPNKSLDLAPVLGQQPILREARRELHPLHTLHA